MTDETEWFTVESAPLDGTTIRVRDRQYAPCHARFVDGHWRFVEYTSFMPTHWQPSPPPRPQAAIDEALK